MKKVFSILFITLFITAVISISKISHSRNYIDVNREHPEQIDCGTKLNVQFDNFNLLSADESKNEVEAFTFDYDLFVTFLTTYFHQKLSQTSLQIVPIQIGNYLPKYILFHSLQIDY